MQWQNTENENKVASFCFSVNLEMITSIIDDMLDSKTNSPCRKHSRACTRTFLHNTESVCLWQPHVYNTHPAAENTSLLSDEPSSRQAVWDFNSQSYNIEHSCPRRLSPVNSFTSFWKCLWFQQMLLYFVKWHIDYVDHLDSWTFIWDYSTLTYVVLTSLSNRWQCCFTLPPILFDNILTLDLHFQHCLVLLKCFFLNI